MKKSRVFILLAVFFCLVTALCVTAGAATVGGDCGAQKWNEHGEFVSYSDNVKWSLDTDVGELSICGAGSMGCYYYDLAPWYSYRDDIKTVIIENGVTDISARAFEGCNKLTSITIPDSVTGIGDYAFARCGSLTSITMPNSITCIGNNAFEGTPLTAVTLPLALTSIGNGAFYWCSLTSVTIPDSVTSIGRETFAWCNTLTSVTIGKGVTSIGDDAFCGCSSLTSITIPDSVTSIGVGAFDGCSSLASVTIGKGVTSIGYKAFEDCSALTSISLPNGVTSISDMTFFLCNSLTSIEIPDSVTSIGDEAFENCWSLTSVTIPNSVTNIGSLAFEGCSLLTIYGYTDSYAETYAAENSIPFVALTQLTLVSKTAAVYKNNTAAVRFIVKLSLAENAVVENYGILLAQTAEQARVKAVILTDAFEGSVTTYAVDLVGIPQKDFDTEIYAWAFVKLVGVEEKIVLPISAVTVNSVLTEMGA